MIENWYLEMTIFAIIAGPIWAVLIAQYLANRKEKRDHRLHVFATLMATRTATLHPEHVRALNAIDVVFYDDEIILTAWRHYRSLLYVSKEEFSNNAHERTDLLDDLLQKMGRKLDYDFDIKNIKTSSYNPQMYEDEEIDNITIRQMWRQVLANERAIPFYLAKNEAIKPPDKSSEADSQE